MSLDHNPAAIGEIYTGQAQEYARFQAASFPWLYVEKPAFDRYVSDFYTPDTRILDVACGTGIVARHFQERGVDSRNIVGLDVSEGLLQEARRMMPDASLVRASADKFGFKSGAFDLVTSNMAFHYLDDEQLAQAFDSIYDALIDDGRFFFITTNPDYSEETRDPRNVRKWIDAMAPWGESLPLFNRDPYDLLLDISYYAGFDLEAGWPIGAVAEAADVDPEEFARYSQNPTRRIAVRMRKVSPEEKQFRLDNIGRTIEEF